MAAAITGFPTPVPMDTMHMRLNSAGMGKPSSDLLANSISQKQRAKFKLEPMKLLEPSNKKLTLPESQRIMYILDELIRQLEILDMMEVITNNDERVGNLIRSDMSEEEKKNKVDKIFLSMCHNHRTLIETHKKGKFEGSGTNVRSRETLDMLIKNSSKDILRVVLKKPSWFDNLKRETQKIKINHPQINELKAVFNEIKLITQDRLLTTPNEEKEKMEYLKELLIREKANSEIIKKLKAEEALALADKDRDVRLALSRHQFLFDKFKFAD